MTTIDRRQIGTSQQLGTGTPEVVVVGGAGHVGLPLSLALADAGFLVGILDTSQDALAAIAQGKSPFLEPGTEALMRRLLVEERLSLSSEAAGVRGADIVVVVVSVSDEGRWSTVTALDETIDRLVPYLADGALLILRNTVYPGTTAHVRERLRSGGLELDLAFCPERMVQGRALEEIRSLPQIVGADDDRVGARAGQVFERLGTDIVRVTTREAELAKLVANAYRYVSFAVANELWMLADDAGVDYGNVLHAVRHGYPRAQGLPGPGFAGGPCLMKDTLALAEFAGPDGALLRAALKVNEDLPSRVVAQMEARFGGLAGRRVGLLGMAFKAGSDDTRNAPSLRLLELLERAGAIVLCTDPFVHDATNVPLQDVLAQSEIVVIATPHSAYRELDVPVGRLVDIWGITTAGIVA